MTPPALEVLARTLASDVECAGRLVSPRVGIISSVRTQDLAPDDPAVHFVWSAAPPRSYRGARAADYNGTGASVDRDRAVMKAVGESIERYCAAAHDAHALAVRSHDELQACSVAPESWCLFSDDQYAEAGFPFAPLTAQTPVRWLGGHSLVHDRPVHVPAAFVYLPYDRDGAAGWRETRFSDPVSTGLACAGTRDRAVYKALAEVVERDAFTLVWQHRLERPAIDLRRPAPALVRRSLDALSSTPVRCHASLLTLDIPMPVVLVTLMTTTDRCPLTVIGLGADHDPWYALALALEEACMSFAGLRRALGEASQRTRAGGGAVGRSESHALAWALDPALRSQIAFLTDAQPSVDLGDLVSPVESTWRSDLSTLVGHLASDDYDVIAIDLTTRDVDDVGFKVVRVVVPGLQPLDLDCANPHRGGRRLRDVARRFGLSPACQPNPIAHPLS